MTANYHHILEHLVSELIRAGWTVQGGVAVSLAYSPSGHLYMQFAQAMLLPPQ